MRIASVPPMHPSKCCSADALFASLPTLSRSRPTARAEPAPAGWLCKRAIGSHLRAIDARPADAGRLSRIYRSISPEILRIARTAMTMPTGPRLLARLKPGSPAPQARMKNEKERWALDYALNPTRLSRGDQLHAERHKI